MSEKAIMVTGSAGFVGQQLLRSLTAIKQAVVAVYHHKLPESLEQIYPVCVDFSSAELMAAPLRGVDTVVHLAWEGGLRGPAVQPDALTIGGYEASVNLRTLSNLIKAMERSGSKRLVFVSALGAAADAKRPFLLEKYCAETLVLNSSIPERIIIRSGVVWSELAGGDRFLRSLVRLMRFPVYPLPSKGSRLAMVHRRDLCQIIVDSCSYPLAQPVALLEVGGGESYQLPDVFRIVSNLYVKKPRLPLGGILGRSLLPLLERERRVGAGNPRLADYLALGAHSAADTETANPLLSVIPRDLQRLHAEQ